MDQGETPTYRFETSTRSEASGKWGIWEGK